MRIVRFIGYCLMALLAVGLCLSVLDAWREGRWFHGVNYKGLAIGTYSTGLMILMICAIGLVWGVAKVVRIARRQPPRAN